MPLSATEAGQPFSVAMKEGSAEEHEAAEQSPFVSELLAGRVNGHGYADYLRRLRVVYDALEKAVRARRDNPLVAAVYDPALERLSAIDADLDHWAPDAAHEVESPAAQAYRDRIAGAVRADPPHGRVACQRSCQQHRL